MSASNALGSQPSERHATVLRDGTVVDGPILKNGDVLVLHYVCNDEHALDMNRWLSIQRQVRQVGLKRWADRLLSGRSLF